MALVVCLNVGVDPPDVTKTQPCARVECWVDPMTLNPQRALEGIGNNLQRQYERWQPRARYRQSLDPTVEEVRRLVRIYNQQTGFLQVTTSKLLVSCWILLVTCYILLVKLVNSNVACFYAVHFKLRCIIY